MSDTMETILRFPQERAVGWVTAPRPGVPGPPTSTPAQGDVAVRAGTATLVVPGASEAADLPGFVPGDLSGLADLEPDALQMVVVQDATPGMVRGITHLTGLARLNIAGRVTDDDLEALAPLRDLASVQITTDVAIGPGLAHLGGRAGLTTLALSCSEVSADGLAALTGLDGLRMLILTAGHLGRAHLDALPALPNLQMLVLAETVDITGLTALVARLPALTDVHCTLSTDDEIALRKAAPKLNVNGTWLPASAVDRLGDDVAPLEVDEEPRTDVKPVELTAATWDDAIDSDIPVLVDFWAEWCGPCHAIAPTIDALASQLAGRVTVAKLDVDANADIPSRYGIMGIPALLVFRKGELIGKIGKPTREGILQELGAVLG